MYGYATVSYNQILDHLKFGSAHTSVKAAALGKKHFRQSQVNSLMSEAIINSPYCRRLIVTHIRN